jgi:hypothetical protein
MHFLKLPGLLPDATAALFAATEHWHGATSHVLPQIPLKDLCPELHAACEELMRAKMTKSRVFVTRPFTNTGIHVDGQDWKNGNKWALNIPIFGCSGTRFSYFEVPEKPALPARADYPDIDSYALRFEESDVLAYLDWVEIDCPTLVQTNVAHRSENPTAQPRVILSCRFDRSQSTSLSAEIRSLMRRTTQN